MGNIIIEVFDKTERLVSDVVAGCGEKYGMPCTAGLHCFCRTGIEQSAPNQNQLLQFNNAMQQQHLGNNQFHQGIFPPSGVDGMSSYQLPIQGNPHGGGDDFGPRMAGMGGRVPRASMRMSLGGLAGLGRHMSLTSETTFGRAMSGLSALSIDWENMDDFDINVDHSAGINNDIVNSQQQHQQGQNLHMNQQQIISDEGIRIMGVSCVCSIHAHCTVPRCV